MEAAGGAVAASRPAAGSAVAFSWEQEPGVSKQGASEEAKKTAAHRAEAASRRTPPSATNKSKKPPAPAHRHRLRVPPPPGGPGAPPVLPAGNRSRPRSRAVRPRDDPFLAAYLACTDGGGGGGGNGGRGYRGTQRLLGWAGLGLGLRLGLGLSCKSSCGAVEECVVRLAKIPELRDED
ncbi:hypothetical protein BS78_01G127600 [Paspalum vaginatum]|nr:hypothetical protein BS78_01G127600 [Paspalum vaginatum]